MNENFTLDVCYGDIRKSITFNLNYDFPTFKSKIDSNFDIYRKADNYEIIERRSSNETLEDLLKRGIKVEHYIIYYGHEHRRNKKFINSFDYSDFIKYVKKDFLLF